MQLGTQEALLIHLIDSPDKFVSAISSIGSLTRLPAGRKGRDLGISTPTADLIYAAVLPIDLKARGQGSL